MRQIGLESDSVTADSKTLSGGPLPVTRLRPEIKLHVGNHTRLTHTRLFALENFKRSIIVCVCVKFLARISSSARKKTNYVWREGEVNAGPRVVFTSVSSQNTAAGSDWSEVTLGLC